MLQKTLADANISELAAQAFVLVDRSAQVQAAFVVVRTQGGGWDWVGATAVSTGKTGTFEHFLTPLGVFPHTLDNPDFRAEGTFNKNHIRGYGLRGRRIFDFGWQTAERGWGAGGTSKMRQQALADGKLLWVIRGDRRPFAWPGRYMVIVDSETTERPAWSPLPGAKPVKNIDPAARQASQAQAG